MQKANAEPCLQPGGFLPRPCCRRERDRLSTAKAIVPRHHGCITNDYRQGVISFAVSLPGNYIVRGLITKSTGSQHLDSQSINEKKRSESVIPTRSLYVIVVSSGYRRFQLPNDFQNRVELFRRAIRQQLVKLALIKALDLWHIRSKQ